MRDLLGIVLLVFCLLVNAIDYHQSESLPASALTDGSTGNTDERATAESSLRNSNNDWLTDDDDDDDDESLDESQLNVLPAAKSRRKPTPYSARVKFTAKPLSYAQVKSNVLAALNGVRRLFGAGPLIWLATLDIGANTANNKLRKMRLPKNDPSIKHGQLQCIRRTTAHKLGAECVARWVQQMRNYDWSKPGVKRNNKFFVQAVWKAATHAGIAVKKGRRGKYFVTILVDPAVDKAKLKENVKSYTDFFTAAPGVKCRRGYTDYSGTCYKLHKDKKSWMNANAECLKELAVLPTIISGEEKNFFKKRLLKGQTGFTWLGYNDRLSESMYISVDGSQIKYMDWVNGQPTGKNENCVGFDNKAKYGTMADYPCATPSTYVCKKPLEGYITYLVKIELVSMVWLDDLSESGSLAYQQLVTKLKAVMKTICTKAGIKVLKSVTVTSISNGLPAKSSHSAPPPAPAPPAIPYMFGKRQVVAIKVTPAPTSSAPTKPTGGASTPSGKATPSKALTTKPKKKVIAVVGLEFGPRHIPSDPTMALQKYLKASKDKLPAPLNERVKLISISIAPPGSVSTVSCNPICSYSCLSSCAASCCYSSQPAPIPVPFSAPAASCGPPPMIPCSATSQPTANPPQTPKPNAITGRSPTQPKCLPSSINSCPPPLPFPYPQPVLSQYPMASPCIPSPMNNYCRSNVAMRSNALNGNRRLAQRHIPGRTAAYRFPFQPFRRIVPRRVNSRPVYRSVMPPSQVDTYGAANPCIPTAYSPCPPPPSAAMMAPQYSLPQAAPCYPTLLNPCNPVPKAPPKKVSMKVAKPKYQNIVGQIYPPGSIMLPPPPPMPYVPSSMPCTPTPLNPCPPRLGPMKVKSNAPKPCKPTPFNACPPVSLPMPMPMPMSMPMTMRMPMPMPMPMPMQMSMPMPIPPPCTPTPTNPCFQPTKRPPPLKPMLIKLPPIQIKVPQQQLPPQPPPMPCPALCGQLPGCPSMCPTPCCKRARLGRAV